MSITHIKIRAGAQAEEKVIAIQTILDNVENPAVQGAAEPVAVYPMLERVTPSGNALLFHFRVKLPQRVLRATSGTAQNDLTRRAYSNNGYRVKEEKGFLLTYEMTAEDSRMHNARIRWTGATYLPNVYSDNRLCFGSNSTQNLGADGTILSAIVGAINIFFSAKFNGDLRDVSGGRSGNYKQLLTSYVQQTHPTRQDVLTLMNNVPDSEFKNSYTLIALASLLNVSLTEIGAVIQ